jgi:hypothetical protein
VNYPVFIQDISRGIKILSEICVNFTSVLSTYLTTIGTQELYKRTLHKINPSRAMFVIPLAFIHDE